jgi:hypothetical protein
MLEDGGSAICSFVFHKLFIEAVNWLALDFEATTNFPFVRERVQPSKFL